MIYAPRMVFDFRLALGSALVETLFVTAADFIKQENKPWEYYVGLAFGNAAAATGGIGAVATMWAAGTAVDMLLFRSPEGSSVDLFLNGVLYSTVDLFSVAPEWFTANIVLPPGVFSRLDVVNVANTNPEKTSPINWLAIGDVTITGSNAQARRPLSMAIDTVVFRLKDSEADTREASLPIYIPSGNSLANVQQFVDAVAPEIDALTESQIVGVYVNINLVLPGGLANAPAAGALNERGGLITFDTTGPRADSVRIPAMSRTIMPGTGFSLTETAVAALIARLTTNTNVTSPATQIRPRTTQDYQYSAARKGTKSFRK